MESLEEEKVPVQINTNVSRTGNDPKSDDTLSEAVSTHTVLTNKTKAKSGAVSKHCTTGTCGGKIVTGNAWGRHIATHQGMEITFERCGGDNCIHCQ